VSQNRSRFCIFCGRRDVKLTREHVVSGWMARQIHADRADSFRYEATRTLEGGRIDTKKSTYGMKLIDIKSLSVCEDCNSGWMSGIEQAAQPIIKLLMQGGALSLTLHTQATLASWAAMKMMVIDGAVSKVERPHGSFFALAESRRFYEDAAHKPPASVLLFAARYEGTNDSWLGVADFSWDHSSGHHVRATTQILAIGKFAFAVLGHRITSDIIGHHVVGLDVRHLKTTAYPIHPPMKEFDWPPTSSLDDEGLQDALHRWRLSPPQTSRRDRSSV
jgi:hypothetical protein